MATLIDQVTQKVKQCGSAAFRLTSSSFITFAEKMEKEKLLAAVNDIVICSGNMVKEVHTSTRTFLRQDNLDNLLGEIHTIMDVQNSTNTPVKQAVDTWKNPVVTRNGNYHTFHSDCSEEPGAKCYLAATLWYELNCRRRNEHLPEEVGRIRSRNQRVNEHDLIRKLGTPKDWEVFENNKAENTNTNSGEQFEDSERFVPAIDKANSVNTDVYHDALFRNQIVEAEDVSLNDLRELNAVNQKKHHGVLHSIKKLFKSEKAIPVARPSTSNAQHIQEEKHSLSHSLLSQIDNKHTNVKEYFERLRSKKRNENEELANGDDHHTDIMGSTEPRTDITDTDKNSLMIHIPNNVQKIILVKDGRKITLEI